MTTDEKFLRFSEDVEKKYPGEEADIQKIVDAFMHVQQKTEGKQGHAMRAVHSKSHGSLKAVLSVSEDVPAYLRQGIFQESKSYGAMLRFSTSPSDDTSDKVGGVRGVGLKIIGIEGCQTNGPSGDATTQDFTFVNHPTFPAKDAKAFLMQARVLDNVVSNLPEVIQVAQNTAARTGGELARQLGFDPIGTAVGLLKPESNILGDTFFTGVPIRFGEYIAKVALVPLSENLVTLRNSHIDTSDNNVLRDIVCNFFLKNEAVWALRVQLCTNLVQMPVEDPSIEWPEAVSPYVTVATLTAPAQNTYSEARNKYVEDLLSFNPWNCVVEHQPLGSIMRARKVVYESSSKYRHSKTGSPRIEPKDISEMPD